MVILNKLKRNEPSNFKNTGREELFENGKTYGEKKD